MEAHEKIGVIASVVTIGGGVLWLMARASSPTTNPAVSPNAAANNLIAPAQVGSGPIAYEQASDNGGIPNYPSWNANLGLPGNVPSLYGAVVNRTDPAYTTYNLPSNGTNLLTSSPAAIGTMALNAAQNAGAISLDLWNALRRLISQNAPQAAKNGNGSGCGCGGGCKGENGHKCNSRKPCNGVTLYGSSEQQAAAYPMTYLSSTEMNTVSGLIPFLTSDPRNAPATDTGVFE